MLLIICNKIGTLKRLHFEANILNGDPPQDVKQKLSNMKGQLWAIEPDMLQSHIVCKVLGQPALAKKVLSMLGDEAHTVKDWGQSRRPDILKLCDVRNILGPSVAGGLFSATMSREHIETAVDAVHVGRRVMDGWDIGPDRGELKYEVSRCSFCPSEQSYWDWLIICQALQSQGGRICRLGDHTARRLLSPAQPADHNAHFNPT